MKKNLISVFVCIFMSIVSFAQNNSLISYQMVVRNSANELVVNKSNIQVVVTLLNDNNSIAYSETHIVTSNRNGLISFFIGNGTPITGSMADVAWDVARLKTSVTIPGEAAVETTRPISSVPHALYADDVDSGVIGAYLTQNNYADSAFVMQAIPDSISAFVNDSGYLTAESQTLGQNGDTIFLTGGSFVTLPISAIENNLANIDNKIDTLNTNFSNTIDTLKNNITAIENNIDTLKNDIYDNIDSIKNDIVVLYDNIDTLNYRIDSLNNRIDSLESNIDSLTTIIDDLLADFNDLQHSVCMPRAQTNVVDNITETSAECGGSVISYCGTAILERGVCYSLQTEPTITGAHVACGNGNGGFSANLTGLQGGTSYYYRTYAISATDTIYGTQESFTTVPTCGQLTVTDIDSNVYSTVQIGVQCWMKENLRTSRYYDGTAITYYTGSTSSGYYYDYAKDADKIAKYGFLYDWNAATRNSSSNAIPSGVRGACPKGWHVPSTKEWDLLKQTVSADNTNKCGNSIVAALCSNNTWSGSSTSCAPGNQNTSTLNATGFSAVAAGAYYNSIDGIGTRCSMWTTTNSGSVVPLSIKNSSSSFESSSTVPQAALSVRCLRDED